MKIITDIQEMRCLARQWRSQGSIGFVPTMGYLHQGHLSLLTAARKQNDFVVLSVFVNPTQFGPNEDLERYPRDLAADTALAEQAGVDALFCPTAQAMYPPGYSAYVEPVGLGDNLCGRSRPGHFRGVCTVVLKLFNIVAPHRAYFGQKDAQQLRIIQRMAQDLHLELEVVRMPIVREEDGLALSSRNVYLNAEERQQALALSRSLQRARQMFEGGEKSAAALRQAVLEELALSPLGRVDYVEIVDLELLQPLDSLDKPALLALAVYFGKTRLIDNIILQT